MADEYKLNYKQITHYDLPTTASDYVEILVNVDLMSFGYCCPVAYIDKPIYLNLNGAYNKIEIGKTGMYELHSDTMDKILDIYGVKVPKDVPFTVDYIERQKLNLGN